MKVHNKYDTYYLFIYIIYFTIILLIQFFNY